MPALLPIAFEGLLHYVDGDGSRTSLPLIFTNDAGLTHQDFFQLIDEHIGSEEIIATQWEFPPLSPIAYDWEPTDGLHHAYHSLDCLRSVDEVDSTIDAINITRLITLVKQGGSPEYLQDKTRHDALYSVS